MSRARGFTLLEILIALAIMATAVVACLGAVQASLRAEGAALRTTEATLLVRQKLEEVLAKKEVTEGSDSGTFDGHPAFAWSTGITRAELPLFGERRTDLLRVQAKVTWNDGSPREIVVTTLHRDRGRTPR